MSDSSSGVPASTTTEKASWQDSPARHCQPSANRYSLPQRNPDDLVATSFWKGWVSIDTPSLLSTVSVYDPNAVSLASWSRPIAMCHAPDTGARNVTCWSSSIAPHARSLLVPTSTFTSSARESGAYAASRENDRPLTSVRVMMTSEPPRRSTSQMSWHVTPSSHVHAWFTTTNGVQSLLGSASQRPQSSSTASPKQSPAQSRSSGSHSAVVVGPVSAVDVGSVVGPEQPPQIPTPMVTSSTRILRSLQTADSVSGEMGRRQGCSRSYSSRSR